MSIQALAWVLENSQTTKGARLVMISLANWAGRSGEPESDTVAYPSVERIAHEAGDVDVRTVQRNLRRMEEEGFIEKVGVSPLGTFMYDLVEVRRAWRGERSEAGNAGGGKLPGGRQKRAESDSKRHPTLKGTPRLHAPGKGGQDAVASFSEHLRDADVHDDLVADASELLRRRIKVDGRIVTPDEMACSAAAVAQFRRSLDVVWSLGPHLKSIVMRQREVPSWTPDAHATLVARACENPWWERGRGGTRASSPNVIYGPRAFPRAVEDAAEKGPKRDDPFAAYERAVDR